MAMPQRAAALGLCLLALAASASAACTAGYFNMVLVNHDSGEAENEIAKCLSSMKVALDSTCKVTITASAAGGSFVPAMWTGADSYSYKKWQECPTDGSAVTPGAETAAARKAAIVTAVSGHIYGFTGTSPNKATTIDSITYTTGMVVITSSTKTFTYAITVVSGLDVTTDLEDAANIIPLASVVTGLVENTEIKTTDISSACASGRYGLVVGSVKICGMCPAGTKGDGNGCSSCEPGERSTVKSGTCTSCTAGTYANGGNSDCLPCPSGTYSDADGAAECTQCPASTYAWIPGSTGCLRCVKGVPTCVAGKENGVACAGSGTASPGYHVLSVSQTWAPASCTLTGSYAVPVVDTCPTWTTADGGGLNLQLSLTVFGDCSIDIRPITDKGCSEAGKNGTSSYSYANLQMRAFYATTKTIRSLLPSGAATGVSSYMLAIDQPGVVSGNTLDLRFFGASSTPGATVTSTVCQNTVTTTGGSVAQLPVPASAITSCPSGTYLEANKYCAPCPPGYACASSTKTACAGGTANPYVGGTTSTAYCASCNSNAGNPWTSNGAADYCTVPWYDTTCSENGKEWDASVNACVLCRPGTFRAAGDPNPQCQECAEGKYSGPGATSCDACPVGEYSPSTGLADQQLSGSALHCLACPKGSLALSGIQAATTSVTLTTGATFCDACPAGTYADETDATLACQACPASYYRTGDAAPENNECKPVPAGYKADLALAATSISVCSKGSISYWTGDYPGASNSARVPAADPTNCAACTSNTYAPRAGMANCLPCKGGTVPANSGGQAGPDTCVDCAAGKYRSVYTAQATCDVCGAGSEPGPSNNQACTLCRPGTYKTYAGDASQYDNNDLAKDYCSDCPRYQYQPEAGSTACTNCPAGYETQDEGNTECTPCALGFYNPTASGAACSAAPAGNYVNTTAATYYTPCEVGTFQDVTGADACDPCPPGQYQNAPGSKNCKTCPSGTFSAGQASACRACSAGYYAPAGSAACSPCKPGYYTNTVRSQTCSLCPKGSQCPSVATKAPVACKAGYFSAKDGAKLCTPCPVNYFSQITGAIQCKPCAAGTNTRGLTGQTQCQAVRITTLRRSAML